MQLETMGLKVCATAVSADQAIREAQTHRPRLVLMDMRLLGEKDGVDAALAIHETVGSKMIFITGSNEPSTMARIQEDHPTAVLIKPIADRQLRRRGRAGDGLTPSAGGMSGLPGSPPPPTRITRPSDSVTLTS